MPLGHAQGGSWPKHIIRICNTFIIIIFLPILCVVDGKKNGNGKWNILAVIILLMYMYCQGPVMICRGKENLHFDNQSYM